MNNQHNSQYSTMIKGVISKDQEAYHAKIDAERKKAHEEAQLNIKRAADSLRQQQANAVSTMDYLRMRPATKKMDD